MLTKLKMMRDSAKCLLVVIAVMLLAALGAVVMAGEPEPGLVGVVSMEEGATVEIHSTVGGCVGGAMLAVWYSVDRKVRVPGCWRPSGGNTVQVAFADGDVARIPVAAVRKPTSM